MTRTIVYTDDFKEFFDTLNKRTVVKLAQVVASLTSAEVLPTKIIKKLINTDFYELRISTDNEYRIVIFAVDNDNIISASKIVFLNGFLKKDTKDYKKHIAKAESLLYQLSL